MAYLAAQSKMDIRIVQNIDEGTVIDFENFHEESRQHSGNREIDERKGKLANKTWTGTRVGNR